MHFNLVTVILWSYATFIRMQRLLEYGAYYDVPVDGAMFIRGWRLVEQIRKSIHKILWSENV